MTNWSRRPANLLADLEEFVHDHRPHGTLTADATPPAWNGYPAHSRLLMWSGVRALDHTDGCRAGSAARGRRMSQVNAVGLIHRGGFRLNRTTV